MRFITYLGAIASGSLHYTALAYLSCTMGLGLTVYDWGRLNNPKELIDWVFLLLVYCCMYWVITYFDKVNQYSYGIDLLVVLIFLILPFKIGSMFFQFLRDILTIQHSFSLRGYIFPVPRGHFNETI